MSTERMAHFATFGMIILPGRAIALQGITMITETIDGYDLMLINKEVIELRGDDAEIFSTQTKNLARQVMFSTQPGKR